MGRTANGAVAALNQPEEAAAKRAAAEQYFYQKLKPYQTLQQNADRLEAKGQQVLAKVAPASANYVREVLLATQQNMDVLIRQKMMGSLARATVVEINQAPSHGAAAEVARRYFNRKVTTSFSARDNAIRVDDKYRTLAPFVVPERQPDLLAARAWCQGELPAILLAKKREERARASRSSTSYGGGFGSGG